MSARNDGRNERCHSCGGPTGEMFGTCLNPKCEQGGGKPVTSPTREPTREELQAELDLLANFTDAGLSKASRKKLAIYRLALEALDQRAQVERLEDALADARGWLHTDRNVFDSFADSTDSRVREGVRAHLPYLNSAIDRAFDAPVGDKRAQTCGNCQHTASNIFARDDWWCGKFKQKFPLEVEATGCSAHQPKEAK